jgi:GNAT superfamily N-acetyltransferase
MLTIEQVDPQSQTQVHRFVELPYRLFATFPQWVPPLFANVLQIFDRETHPLYEHSEADFFMAVRDGRDVGRIAVYAPRDEGASEAKFYLFDSVNDIEVATALFERAFEWARQRGLKKIIGPKGFTMLDGSGILIKGFDYAPIIETMTYNYDYYIPLIEAMGFEKEADQNSYTTSTDRQAPAWLHQIAARVRQKEGLHIKSFSTMPELLDWTPRFLETFKKAFNYPLIISRQDAFVMDYFKTRSNPRLMKAIMYGDEANGTLPSEVVGVFLAIPNISAALQRTRGQINIDQLRQEIKETKRMTILALGFLPEFQLQGINAVLFSEIEKTVREAGIQQLDILWVSEATPRMKNDLQAMGMQPTHTHRLYIRDL